MLGRSTCSLAVRKNPVVVACRGDTTKSAVSKRRVSVRGGGKLRARHIRARARAPFGVAPRRFPKMYSPSVPLLRLAFKCVAVIDVEPKSKIGPDPHRRLVSTTRTSVAQFHIGLTDASNFRSRRRRRAASELRHGRGAPLDLPCHFGSGSLRQESRGAHRTPGSLRRLGGASPPQTLRRGRCGAL